MLLKRIVVGLAMAPATPTIAQTSPDEIAVRAVIADW